MNWKIVGIRCTGAILVGALGFGTVPAAADVTDYVSELKTIDSVYQACVAKLKTLNVHCVKGRDYTNPFGYRMPTDDLNNVPAYKEMTAQSEADGDKERLFRLSLNAQVPSDNGGNRFFVFVYVYREFFPYSRIPVVHASVSTWVHRPDRSGIVVDWQPLVEEYIQSLLAQMPVMSVDSPQGKNFLASLEATFKKQDQAAKEQAKLKKQQATPTCKSIVFTGYAAVIPQNLSELTASSDPRDFAARNPIACSDSRWGGTYKNGAVINQNRMTQCRGVGFFDTKHAEILDWTPGLYQIRTDVDFNTGRRAMALFVQRTDATCLQ